MSSGYSQISGAPFRSAVAWAVTLLALLTAALGAPAGATVFDVDRALQKAEQLTADGLYEEAIKELTITLIDIPDSEKVRVYDALSWIKLIDGDIHGALDDMDTAVKYGAQDPCVYLRRAGMYWDLSEPGMAAMEIDKALRNGCRNPDAHTFRGKVYIQQGDPLNGVRRIFRGLGGGADRLDSYSYAGFAYTLLGYPGVAADYYSEALKLNPGNAGMHAELADALVMSGELKRSFKHYERAVELDPGNGIAANNYAYTLFMEGRIDRAREIFLELNKSAPSPYSLCNTMEIAIYERDWSGALTYGKLCLSAFEAEDDTARSERFYVHAIVRALRTIQRDKLSMHHRTQIDLAKQHLEHGEYIDAVAAYLMALMMDPKNLEATYEAGRLMVLMGDKLKGFSFLNVAAGMAGPGHPAAISAKRIIDRETLLLSDGAWIPADENPFAEKSK